MNRTTTFFSWCGCLGIVLLAALPTPSVLADSCPPAWTPGVFQLPGTNGTIWALTVFDDGTGPALYAGGWFTTAGAVSANCIAKWDGTQWSALGSGMDDSVLALTVFDDDGAGPHPAALYAGGDFTTAGGVWANRIAKWDGTQWSALASGMDSTVRALTVFDDDGAGPHSSALYAGGEFTTAGGVSAHYIAKWDGTQWAALSSGMNDRVYALTVFDDDGAGPHPAALYAGGDFATAGGVSANRIAKWDGTQWSALGSGMDYAVSALTVFDDDGDGPHLSALYAGGFFTTAGGVSANSIAKWDGTQWSALGSGMNYSVHALTVFDDDGAGPHPSALYAGGDFWKAGGVSANRVAKWDGTQWSALGSGMSGDVIYPGVWALTVFDDDGAGPHPSALYAGGNCTTAGGVPAYFIAKWDGTQWSALPLGNGMNNGVSDLTVFDDDGAGPHPPALYAGGWFTAAGGVSANSIAKWDGTQWSALGSGTNGAVYALTVFDDDGAGPHPSALYAGGGFATAGSVSAKRIAKWDGTQWSALGNGMGGTYPYVYTLTAFDDDGAGPHPSALYAGGSFTTAGGVSANRIAKWDGTQWSALGSGMGGAYSSVFALTVFDDDGAGPHPSALYAGGSFSAAGGVLANRIAKWNGIQWSALGSGMNNGVWDLTVFDDDGAGPHPSALYAGGNFTTAGSASANCIAKWNGTQWSALGSGMNDYVYALTGFDDDGAGPHPSTLYAGGDFTTAGGLSANRIAKWDGAQWSALGSGMDSTVRALTVFDDDGAGPHPSALYAGGYFTAAGHVSSGRMARWGCQTSPTDDDGDGIPNDSDNCPEHYNPSQADCDGDGIGDACQPGATDCNGNDIPDECDLAAGSSNDCQSNGVPDECDIAGGTSPDANTNGIPDECEPPPPALLTAAVPADQSSLWRSANNTIRLTFDGDITAPAPGQILIQQMLEGADNFGPDLSASFTFTVENVDIGGGVMRQRILRIRENGSVLTHRTWIAIRNAETEKSKNQKVEKSKGGDWADVAPFEIQYVVMVGDVNADKKVLATDLSSIFPKIPTANAADQERADVNGDGEVLATDLSAVFPRIPSATPPKPSGH